MFRQSRPSATATVFALGAAVMVVVGLGACGRRGGGDAVRAILCGSGHTKGLMSVGLNLGVLRQMGVKTSNAGLRDDLNNIIRTVGVDPGLISIKTVESVDKSADDASDDSESLRFLELGGALGGLGKATELLFEAVGRKRASLNLASSEDFFSFARESFRTGIASPVPDARDENLRLLFSPQAYLTQSYSPPREQWAYAQTDFQGAIVKLLQNASRKVRVAVLDTGIDLEHPNLKDVLVPGKNFAESGKSPQDGNGHGTHCAGIIGSLGKNGGPVGVAAPLHDKGLLEIMPVKVLGDKGSGDSQAVEKGVRWAVKNGADVISMSLGGGRDFEEARREGLVDRVIKEAVDAGVIVIVAAGNESCPLGGECKGGGLFSANFREYIVHPCSYEGTICVGATNADETLAPYSNYSSKKTTDSYRTHADVNAPGTNIYSTWPVALSRGEPYKAISGTSMATPYVAGVAALIRANNPAARQADVMKLLMDSQVFPDQIKKKSDAGRLDLMAVANRVTGATDAPAPQPKPVDDPNRSEDGQPLGLVSLWQAMCTL